MKKFLIAATASVAILGASVSANTASAGENPLGLLLGAAAGGLVGSQIGQGQGRIVATAAGTFIGAMIGANVSNSSYDRAPSYSRTTYRSPRQIYAPYRYADTHAARTVYVDNRTYINNTTVTQTTVNHTDYNRYSRPTYWHR